MVRLLITRFAVQWPAVGVHAGDGQYSDKRSLERVWRCTIAQTTKTSLFITDPTPLPKLWLHPVKLSITI